MAGVAPDAEGISPPNWPCFCTTNHGLSLLARRFATVWFGVLYFLHTVNCLVTPDFIGFTSSDLVISPWFVGTIDLVQFGCCVASQCAVTSGEIMACTFSWVQATILAATDFLNQMTPSTGIFARCPAVSSVSISLSLTKHFCLFLSLLSPLSLCLRALKVPCDTTSHLSRYLLLDAIYVIYMYHCITFKVKAFPTMFFKTRAWRQWPNSDVILYYLFRWEHLIKAARVSTCIGPKTAFCQSIQLRWRDIRYNFLSSKTKHLVPHSVAIHTHTQAIRRVWDKVPSPWDLVH